MVRPMCRCGPPRCPSVEFEADRVIAMVVGHAVLGVSVAVAFTGGGLHHRSCRLMILLTMADGATTRFAVRRNGRPAAVPRNRPSQHPDVRSTRLTDQ